MYHKVIRWMLNHLLWDQSVPGGRHYKVISCSILSYLISMLFLVLLETSSWALWSSLRAASSLESSDLPGSSRRRGVQFTSTQRRSKLSPPPPTSLVNTEETIPEQVVIQECGATVNSSIVDSPVVLFSEEVIHEQVVSMDLPLDLFTERAFSSTSDADTFEEIKL